MEGADFRIDNKVALVTGAAQGIGKASAIALANAGAAVAIIDLPSKSAHVNEICEVIKKNNGIAQAYILDIRNIIDIEPTINQIVIDFGQIDILVNNAGVQIKHNALEVTEEEWDATIDTNLKGMFFIAQAVARHMVKHGGGRIINFSSVLAVSGMPGRSSYTASKGGIAAMTRSLATELAGHNITVNAIGPGPTDTDMAGELTPERAAAIKWRSPIGRRLEPEEITGTVVFLASPASAALTGQVLMVDGGWTAA